jgi:small Trp-rich protein
MYLVLVGTLMLLLKFADVDPVAGWSWWWVLAPFGLAVLWWSYSDASGLTQKRAMDRIEDRKEARRRKAFEALGIDHRRHGRNKKKAEAFRRVHEQQIDKVEAERDAERKRHAETITRSSQFKSQFDSTQASVFDTSVQPARK